MPRPLPTHLEIAIVRRPHGVNGEVRIACSQDQLEFLVECPLVRVGETDLQIESVRGSADSPIVAFEGVEDRDEAGRLRGMPMLARREDLPDPDENEWFLGDLDGCDAYDVADGGRLIGEVVAVQALPANAVLTVKLAPGISMAGEETPAKERAQSRRGRRRAPEVLVPLTPHVVPMVDVHARRIEIDAAFVGVAP